MLPFRTLIVAFLLVWLPTKAVFAVAMPFCQHGTSGTVAAAASHRQAPATAELHHDHQRQDGHHGHHSHHADGPAGSAPNQSATAATAQACDGCGSLCSLYCASVLPAQALSIKLAADPVFQATPGHFFSLFVPESAQRPPLVLPA